MVTFHSSRKLSSYLVRAKLYPLERVTGSCKCLGKRCAVFLNVNETSTFTSSVTHETYKINHKFDCNSKCYIYLLKVQSCKSHNNKYMIASTQITNTEIFAFIAVLVFKLLSHKALFINRKDNRNN